MLENEGIKSSIMFQNCLNKLFYNTDSDLCVFKSQRGKRTAVFNLDRNEYYKVENANIGNMFLKGRYKEISSNIMRLLYV